MIDCDSDRMAHQPIRVWMSVGESPTPANRPRGIAAVTPHRPSPPPPLSPMGGGRPATRGRRRPHCSRGRPQGGRCSSGSTPPGGGPGAVGWSPSVFPSVMRQKRRKCEPLAQHLHTQPCALIPQRRIRETPSAPNRPRPGILSTALQ